MIYGSVCSGIESASVAWEPLGLRPAWFSEIEPFPSAVLAHHWPHVANMGDMTQVAGMIRAGLITAPDILVGGTPCQAFSVAGLRKGLDDARGQLTLTYVDILNAIDEQRGSGDEAVCVWENVPGVLSSKDNAFGCFLGALAGESCELQPPGRKWANAGYVLGPQRAIAWRILDAQFFGVAQRRRRVFVVASARDGFDPRKVLFESEGVRRDTAPSREKGSQVASLTACGVGTCGADDNQAQAGHIVAMAHGQGGAEINDTGQCPTLTCNHEAPIVTSDPARPLLAKGNDSFDDTLETYVAYGFQPRIARNGRGDMGDVAHSLSAQSGTTGKGDSAPCVAIGIDWVVRRLTPTECARLQGFPDNHGRIPWRGKPAEQCPDGPRYKACGNSKAVPVVRFVGLRVVSELIRCAS